MDAGVLVITAFISPYRDDRRLARSLVNEGEFVEVYVNAPLEVCEQRDSEGPLQEGARGSDCELHRRVRAVRAARPAEIVVHTDKQTPGGMRGADH